MTPPNRTLKRPATSASRAYEQIKLKAVSWQFLPGTRINELQLAEELSLSRTPIRDALTKLAAEGFVTLVPNKGFFFKTFDPKHIIDLYEMRAALERMVVLLVCARASDEDIASLEELVTDEGRSGQERDPLTALQEDERFHRRLAEIGGNALIRNALESIADQLHFVRLMEMKSRKQSQGRHQRLLAMLKERRSEAASDEISKNIIDRKDHILKLISSGLVELFNNR